MDSDIAISADASNGIFCAILFCSKDPATKILRTSVGGCPIAAVREIVEHLHEETFLLMRLLFLAQ
jgi:hypothetical protein